MNKLQIISRILLGLIFFIFGLNYFLGFLKMSPMPGNPAEFMKILYTTKFLLVVKIIEIIGGFLLLTNLYARLGLILVTPITINILLFHILIAPPATIFPLGVIMIILNGFLIYSYRENFCFLCKKK